MAPLELWAGVEPAVNRIADAYENQLVRTRHWDHPEDLARFADLGLRVLRHPLLWELVAPDGLKRADWSWFDERFALLKHLGIRPIAGLLHHGSGPRDTSLVAANFAGGLAEFARACAERYPWIEDYTPVHAPLKTARRSTMDGVWYPHAKDPARLCRALVNQCRATVLAMEQVRAVNPNARLIQTEELSGPPSLGWLTFELLCGRVGCGHDFWNGLRTGVSEAELEFFLDHPCPPDVLGVGVSGESGTEALLMQAWDRYRRPLALTDVHVAGPREAQLRWLDQAWRGSKAARTRGADVRAVTAWALLGAYDENGYAPGAFDLRAPKPRPTALAHLTAALARHGTSHHPALAGRPLLIAGGGGRLGRALAQACEARGLSHRRLVRGELDITDDTSVARALERFEPWAIVNAAGYEQVREAERDPRRCVRENTLGPKGLAKAAEQRGIPLVTFSSALVFDGTKGHPYLESDPVSPDTVYGFTKSEAERCVLKTCERGLVIRSSALFDFDGSLDFVTRTANELRLGKAMRVIADECVSPTYVPDLVRLTLDLLLDEAWGLWHLVSVGAVSWADFARRVAERLSLPPNLVEEKSAWAAPRCLALASERASLMPSLDDALERCLEARSLRRNVCAQQTSTDARADGAHALLR